MVLTIGTVLDGYRTGRWPRVHGPADAEHLLEGQRPSTAAGLQVIHFTYRLCHLRIAADSSHSRYRLDGTDCIPMVLFSTKTVDSNFHYQFERWWAQSIPSSKWWSPGEFDHEPPILSHEVEHYDQSIRRNPALSISDTESARRKLQVPPYMETQLVLNQLDRALVSLSFPPAPMSLSQVLMHESDTIFHRAATSKRNIIAMGYVAARRAGIDGQSAWFAA